MATEYKNDMDDDNDVTVDGQCADEKTRSRQSDEPIRLLLGGPGNAWMSSIKSTL